MDKLSGLVIDVGDDFNGAVLSSIYPTAEAVPEHVKTAEVYSPERRAQLPDDLFALVMLDGDVVLRKFACLDAANTELSMQYFLKTAHKLPEAAAKVAAENLCRAASWYDLEVPDAIQKVALGLASMLQLGIAGPQALKTAKGGVERNLEVARQSGGQVNPNVLGGAGAPTVG